MRRTTLFCFCGAVAGLAAGVFWKPVYTTTATLTLFDRASEPDTFDQRRREFFTSVRAEVLDSEPLARHADIRLDENQVCTIRFTSSDRRDSQRATLAIVTRFINVSAQRDADTASLAPSRQAILNRLDWLEARTAALEGIPSYMGEATDRTSKGGATVGVELLNPPVVPQRRENQWVLLWAGVGALAGLVAGTSGKSSRLSGLLLAARTP
jgi:hypothetical protein